MTSSSTSDVPPLGRIDVHCHLLPGVDDGCRDVSDSIAIIRQLKQIGYSGSICTPHVWPTYYPLNTIARIRKWTTRLSDALKNVNIEYKLWPGAELRLFKEVVPWMRSAGVPTLADSNCVLADFWDPGWPAWVTPAFDWLLRHGYQPILAHPERIVQDPHLDEHLKELEEMGVWLQGNLRCFSGYDLPGSQPVAYQLLRQNRYQMLGMDTHRPGDLTHRWNGMVQIREQYGRQIVDYLTVDAPRRLILQSRNKSKAAPARRTSMDGATV